MFNQKTHFLTDINDHFLNSDGDMSCYFIDEEQNSIALYVGLVQRLIGYESG